MRYDADWFERVNRYEPKHAMLPWSWFGKSGLAEPLLPAWRRLLASPATQERHITQFLKRYAGLFFYTPIDYPLVLTEIRLGAEFVVDVVLASDQWSGGTKWHLIEVELPGSPPFKKNGDKSPRLCHALDQVEFWRSWLRRCCRKATSLFPSDHEIRVDFHIIIGTRRNSRMWLERRNELSDDYKVSIRSFDSLTHKLGVVVANLHDETSWKAHDQPPFTPAISNALGNPFFEAFGHREWTETLRESFCCGRIMDLNVDTILARRSYNGLLKQFERFCRSKCRLAYQIWLREFRAGRYAGSLWHLADS